MLKAQKYLENNIIDRLYNKKTDVFAEIKKERFVLENADAFISNLRREIKKPCEEQRFDTNMISNTERLGLFTLRDQQLTQEDLLKMPFLERQKYYQEQSEFERVKLLSDCQPTFQPLLTQNTTKKTSSDDIYERGKKFLEEIEEKKRQLAAMDAQECKFRPELTKFSKEIPKKSVDELLYEPEHKKRNFIAEKLIERETKFRDQYTFKPNLSLTNKEYSKVESKLGLDKSHKEYIDHQKKAEIIKQNLQLMVEQNRHQREIESCTFKPNICHLPPYLKKTFDYLPSSRSGSTSQLF
jgi:hypothetical protein